MAYTGLILQTLISAPGDLPPEHRAIVARTLRAWNSTHGKFYGLNFSPTDYQEGGASAFGEYPQEVLNEQIVNDSDIGIVVFTDRLGTPTPEHLSGTAEEIQVLLDAGRDVAVMLNECTRSPLRGDALKERAKLDKYLSSIEGKAFVARYDSELLLAQRLEVLLARLAAKFRREADASLAPARTPAATASDPPPAVAEVETGIWPRVEVTESVSTDSRGRTTPRKNWYLVLDSNLPYAARNVSYRYEDGDGGGSDFDILAGRRQPDGPAVQILPPGGNTRFPILQAWGSPSSAMCVVTWEDPSGSESITRATVRTR